MTDYHDTCPQCQGEFVWLDGYHDLYDRRLCSLACRDAWIHRLNFMDIQEKPSPQMTSSRACPEWGDGRAGSSPEYNDLPILEDPHRQME